MHVATADSFLTSMARFFSPHGNTHNSGAVSEPNIAYTRICTIMHTCMCMYVYRSGPLCDCVHGKRQHQPGPTGEVPQRSSLFATGRATWFGTYCWLSCTRPCSRTLSLGWRTMSKYFRTVPDPFAIIPSGNWTGDHHFTSRRNHQILTQKDPLWAMGLLLWMEARFYSYRNTKY